MFAIKAKIYEVLYKQSSSIAFDETSSYWSAPKPPNFSAFHWSPHGSLVSIGQNFVTTRVVHLPKRTETSLITESDQSGPNHQLLQLCTARTAWSESDQAVRAVHSCIIAARPAQPGPNRTRLCGPCIAALAGSKIRFRIPQMESHFIRLICTV